MKTNKIRMTETLPAEPIVKPKPKQAPSPKPRRGDPWTVPGPKVNPTPKAIKLNVMTEKKKMLITKKKDFYALKKIVTKEVFYNKFVLSMKLVSEITAEDAITNLYFEDSRALTAVERKNFIKSGQM